MTRPSRLRRSELSTPGTSDKMMTKAAGSEADLVFLDLEDAVAPTQKAGARAPIAAALASLDWGAKTKAVRINGVHTEWCHDDLEAVVTGAGAALDVVIVPKVKAPRDVWFVDTALSQLEDKLGLTPGRIGIEVLIEETEALARVEEIAGCCPRLEALILGVGDLSASQGIRLGHVGETGERYPGDIWHYARNRMIVAARANGLDAIDGPFANFRDAAGYRREAGWATTLGAVGKWAIHPDQVALANEVFSPTEAEIDRARKVVEAVRRAEAAGDGAANLDGVMIDAATARIFETVLHRAQLAGLA
ncbi:MAG TPA: CoA ester lyase [Acidimicrobiales bacterium]|nr:CoA ester lyase [Acidimicrobiales bacterium]